jgi:hypothetical protein
MGTTSLEQGYDSPALRELAGADGEDTQQLRRLFERAFSELEVNLPEGSESGALYRETNR